MKKLLLLLMFIIFSFAGQLQDIQKSLKDWQPLNIQIKSGNLIVTTKERRVTDTIYLAMIHIGLCTDYYFNKNLLNGIKSVSILNRYKHQGYVLDGGANICNKIGKMSNNRKITLSILSKTHLY
jgi:hypothetical protein